MKVYKFGGAALSTPERLAMVLKIIKSEKSDVFVIVSAIGKTTNALENVVKAFYENETKKGDDLLDIIVENHYTIASAILPQSDNYKSLSLKELEKVKQSIKNTTPQTDFDLLYDAIVPLGEKLSSLLVHLLLQSAGLDFNLLCATEIICTDENYRNARVDIKATGKRFLTLTSGSNYIMQGFVGQSANGSTTTLGREGSDYSAALVAHFFDAKGLTVWKDVAGVFNSDPNIFPNAQLLPHLSYRLAAEFTFYGAQVIHPRTLQPLVENNIPLYVKSFLEPELEGTVISFEMPEIDIPLLAFRKDITLVSLATFNVEFISEGAISHIFKIVQDLRIRIYLIQQSALTINLVIATDFNKAQKFIELLNADFNIKTNSGLLMTTIINPDDATINQVLKGKQEYTMQANRRIVHFVTD